MRRPPSELIPRTERCVFGYIILKEEWKISRDGIPGLYQVKHRK